MTELPIVKKQYLNVNPFSRPGYIRDATRAVVIHWIGNAGTSNNANQRYFEQLGQQRLHDDKPDRYASAHIIVGIDGEVLQCMPWEEVAFHVGAREYTDYAKRELKLWTSNKRKQPYADAYWTPNWCTIGIEICHAAWDGVFSEAAQQSAALVCWYLMQRYKLSTHEIIRHYDVSIDARTGKPKVCPKWFVEDTTAWTRFKSRISNMLKIERRS